MIRIFLPLILAALGFVAASCSQSVAPFAPTEAPASAQPAHEAAAAAMPSTPETVAAPQASAPQASAPQASAAPTPATPASTAPAPDPSTEAQASASQAAADPDPSSDGSMPVERRASTLIGMPVVSGDGSPVGEVKDIIFDRQGRATHLVISSSADSKLTAMPWDAALAIIKDGKLVLDGAKLQGAPGFTPDAWPNLDDPHWSAAADTYWRKAIRAAIAAHPGNPIDSTTRQRGRPARDGDGDGN